MASLVTWLKTRKPPSGAELLPCCPLFAICCTDAPSDASVANSRALIFEHRARGIADVGANGHAIAHTHGDGAKLVEL